MRMRPTGSAHYRVEDGVLDWDSASSGRVLTLAHALCDLSRYLNLSATLFFQLQNEGWDQI